MIIDIPYQGERRTWRMGTKQKPHVLASKNEDTEALMRDMEKLLSDKAEAAKHTQRG